MAVYLQAQVNLDPWEFKWQAGRVHYKPAKGLSDQQLREPELSSYGLLRRLPAGAEAAKVAAFRPN